MLIRFYCILIGYAFGLIQTSYICGRLMGLDIRKYGSGNAGTTNSFRILGKKAGVLTLIIDMLKSVLAIWVSYYLFRGDYKDIMLLLMMYTGIGVILGHNFPFYLKFKGGKGIAATGGVIVGIGNIFMILITLGSFILTLLLSGYVSLASIVMTFIIIIEMVVMGSLGIFTNPPYSLPMDRLSELYVLSIIIFLLALFQHRANIKRLLSGTENKFIKKKE